MSDHSDEKGSVGLQDAISNYSKNLTSLREFVGLISPFLAKAQSKVIKDNVKNLLPLLLAISKMKGSGMPGDIDEKEIKEKFGADINIDVSEDGSGCQISIAGNDNAGERFEKAVQEMRAKASHSSLLYRSSLISLISSAEWFLSQVLRKYFEVHPEAAGIKEKTLTLEELNQLGSIADARNHLVNLRVDEIMWGGLEDWLKFLSSTVGLSMSYLTPYKAELAEIFLRRNVIIHNNGVVHPTYIAKVDKSLREKIKIGQDLVVSPKYLQNAIDIVELAFILIAAELWKKLSPKDTDRGSVLTDVVIQRLSEERWRIGEGLSIFTMQDKQLTEEIQLIGKLNYWQSLKWQNRFDAVHGEVQEADFSAKDDIYQLARIVLLDQYSEAFKRLPRLFSSGKIERDHLITWPIFRELRKQSQYQEVSKTLKVASKKRKQKKGAAKK
jgi:hypothetical protein